MVPGAQADCVAQKKGKYKTRACTEDFEEKNGKATKASSKKPAAANSPVRAVLGLSNHTTSSANQERQSRGRYVQKRKKKKKAKAISASAWNAPPRARHR